MSSSIDDGGRGFPGGDADGHVRTIPACAALGLHQSAAPATWLDPAIAATRADDGRIDRGAALILADQATAGGVFATLASAIPMMTLDLRIDWFAPLPADALTCAIDDVVREGDLAFVRGQLLTGDRSVGSVVARFLIGEFPGGGSGSVNDPAPELPPSSCASFADYLGATEGADGIVVVPPQPDHVGARGLPAFHGGVVAALLERTATAAANAPFRPLDIEVRYLAPARADRPLIARATPRRLGRRAATIDVAAWQDDADRPVALARVLLVSDAAGQATLTRFA